MASTPTTKSQVQAYRFVLRRMESALVRKDAVMLHDPMVTHKRAVVGGALVAVLGLVGFMVFGMISGKGGTVGKAGEIVIGDRSGSVYVTMGDNQQQTQSLAPVWNMASAKLLVMARSPDKGPQEPTTVDESELAKHPRQPLTGMPGAPNYLPSPDNQAGQAWAVCDRANVQPGNSEPQAQNAGVETTVVGGQPLGASAPLKQNQSLYVEDDQGQEYLIYQVGGVQAAAPQPGTHVVRAKIPATDNGIKNAYGVRGKPRKISTNLLNSIPAVSTLKTPHIQNARSPVTYGHGALAGHHVGDVVKQQIAGNPKPRYMVLLQDGYQYVSFGVANLIQRTQQAPPFDDVGGALSKAKESHELQVDNYPAVPQSHPVGANEQSVSCLSWQNNGGHPSLEMRLANGAVPASSGKKPVKLAQADGTGNKIDYFAMQPGKAAVVQSTPAAQPNGTGPLFLVSDRGVRYGIKNLNVARGLGLLKQGQQNLPPAPSSIINLLPTGAFLDPAQSTFIYDAPQGPAVNRPPENGKKQAAG